MWYDSNGKTFPTTSIDGCRQSINLEFLFKLGDKFELTANYILTSINE